MEFTELNGTKIAYRQQGEGEPITERLASVPWTGGSIAADEFMEFGVSFRMPDTPESELEAPSS